MAKVAKQIKDKRLLKLIRNYLKSGIMENGIKVENKEGTPQGGPLSPLLSNIMLDELDKELERRKLSYVRYADDIAIFVKSPRAGERVLKGITEYIETKLKLKVNKEKSKVVEFF
jgi:retron-type reverse transcriptase